MSVTPLPGLTWSEDKALKREALRNAGQPVTPQLKSWLDHYRFPTDPTMPTSHERDYHERKRAALLARVAARKERLDNVNNLLQLRARAIKSVERNWPLQRCHRNHKENIHRREVEREREQACQATEVARERAAAAERLFPLSFFSSKLTSPEWSIKIPAMNAPALSANICSKIAEFTCVATHLNLIQLSSSVYNVMLPHLYCHIEVGARAMRFVNSLASNSRLPKIVKTLQFEDSPTTAVDPIQWARVLPAMANLRYLVICCGIPFPHEALPSITFKLRTFGSNSPVIGAWADFVASQKHLQELVFFSDFFGTPPGPEKLPLLRSICGRPADLARFAHTHPLEDLWFLSGPPFGRRSLKPVDLTLFASSRVQLNTIRICAAQFLALFRAAPTLLTNLRHIVLYEELTWSEFTLSLGSRMEGSALVAFAAALDHRFPLLRSLLLVCSQNTLERNRSRRLLLRSDGAFFSSVLLPWCTAPRLDTFRVYAADGCATWKNWRANVEELKYTDGHPTNLEVIFFSIESQDISHAHPLKRVSDQPHVPKYARPASSPTTSPVKDVCPFSRASPTLTCFLPFARAAPTKIRPFDAEIAQITCVRWTGTSFESVTPTQAGMRLRLGHGSGGECPNAVLQQDFRVYSLLPSCTFAIIATDGRAPDSVGDGMADERRQIKVDCIPNPDI
ncbi:hypothetical protein B0H19DRAFT_1080877 [Mycena capillaripes]|nr:hypothetical protein B0H19DRAFT_1080877 [Mycena capillaripes]